MKTTLIITGIVLLLLLYLAVRFILIAIIYYADNMKRQGLRR